MSNVMECATLCMQNTIETWQNYSYRLEDLDGRNTHNESRRLHGAIYPSIRSRISDFVEVMGEISIFSQQYHFRFLEVGYTFETMEFSFVRRAEYEAYSFNSSSRLKQILDSKYHYGRS